MFETIDLTKALHSVTVELSKQYNIIKALHDKLEALNQLSQHLDSHNNQCTCYSEHLPVFNSLFILASDPEPENLKTVVNTLKAAVIQQIKVAGPNATNSIYESFNKLTPVINAFKSPEETFMQMLINDSRNIFSISDNGPNATNNTEQQ